MPNIQKCVTVKHGYHCIVNYTLSDSLWNENTISADPRRLLPHLQKDRELAAQVNYTLQSCRRARLTELINTIDSRVNERDWKRAWAEVRSYIHLYGCYA